ncbi:MAG: surface-adhesin E family protein [Sodaliphilus sp.]
MKALHRLLLLALCLIIATATAQAGEWLEIMSDRGITYYIDSEVSEESDGYIVWAKMDFTTKAARAKVTREAKSRRTIYSIAICYMYNFSFTEYANVSGHYYNANGEEIGSENYPYLEFQRLVPGSNGQMWADAAQYLLSQEEDE